MAQIIETKKGDLLPIWIWQIRRKDPTTDKWEDDDLSDVTAIAVYMKETDTDVLEIDGSAGAIYDLANALVSYSPVAGDVDTVGRYTIELRLTRAGGKPMTVPKGEYEAMYVLITEDNKG